MSCILSAEQLTYSIEGKAICNNLNLEIESGQIWGVLGSNGVGKSTLLKMLSGFQESKSGTIKLNNKPLNSIERKQIAKTIGMLFQHQDDIFPAKVIDVVLMGRHPYNSILNGKQEQNVIIAQQALDQMGLYNMEQRMIDTLSGGERRRVAIATILAQQPKLFILDEPEAHLDPKHQQDIFNQITSTTNSNAGAVIMALHDINHAIQHCTHILMMFGDGEVEQGTTQKMIKQEQVEKLYATKMRRFEEDSVVAYLPV